MKSIKWILGLAGLGLGAALLYSKPASAKGLPGVVLPVPVKAGQFVGMYFRIEGDPGPVDTFAEIQRLGEAGGNLDIMRAWRLAAEPGNVFLVVGKALRTYTALEFDTAVSDSEVITADSGDGLDQKLEVFLEGRGLSQADFEEITEG